MPHATCPAHLILPDFITRTILIVEETGKGIMFLSCTLAPCMSELWNESNVMVAGT
jgi:hypothetical protein